MITTDYTKCLSCRWRDQDNAQCYDGHLQYNGKLECEGFELSLDTATAHKNGSESALNTSDDKI